MRLIVASKENSKIPILDKLLSIPLLYLLSKKLRNLIMKIANSLKTLKSRHKACKVVRRKGRLYVINKQNPRFKARQG